MTRIEYAFDLPINSEEERKKVDLMADLFESAAKQVLTSTQNQNPVIGGRMMQNAITEINKITKRKKKSRAGIEKLNGLLLAIVWLSLSALVEWEIRE